MKNRHIEMIPVAEIRVVNPRNRQRSTFETIRGNIASVGLKKPITVHARTLQDDGTKYDLVFGQGRLESYKELGETTIPAIISQAPEDERYLMSLVENLARRPPSTTDLLREVKRLRAEHYNASTIARKVGMDKSYIGGIVNLLTHGEEDLITRVEAGRMPIETAITIATGTDAEVQRALSDAYDQGILRGAKLHAVRQLIARRKSGKDTAEPKEQVTPKDLVRMYERHTQQQRALVHRSALITQRLAVLTSCFARLFRDDHFITLLRAEGFQDVPEHISQLLSVAGSG
jgi:ParB family chromosome partitioning protein